MIIYLKKTFVFLCLLGFTHSCLWAQDKLIVFTKTSGLPPFIAVLDGFKESLDKNNIAYKLVEYDIETPPPPEIEKADLIFTIGTNPTRKVSDNYKNIPIVFTLALNSNYTGQNITGVAMEVSIKDQLDVLARIKPRPRKIGIMYDPSKTKKLVEQYVHESEGSGFEVLTKQVNSVDDVYRAVRDFRPRIDCLMIIPDQTVYSVQSTEDILLFCLREGVPVVGLSSKYVKAGALFSLSSKYKELGKESGILAARILNGEKPSAIPYEHPEKNELSINLIIAQRIGVTVPDDLVKEAENVYK